MQKPSNIIYMFIGVCERQIRGKKMPLNSNNDVIHYKNAVLDLFRIFLTRACCALL